MNAALSVNLPTAGCINCGPVLVYIDQVEGGDWARCVRCDQMIRPWNELNAVVSLGELHGVGMALVESACNCGSDGGCSSCSMSPESSCA
ncbi:MAG: hypothetical protein OSB21_12235 [Myxococcota bacterium]|jgi:hypothetical protein|nr:hypothetical protein [Myxococcota bacterium]